MSLLEDWKQAKKDFEATAGKKAKRPGIQPAKASKFFKVFQSEATGLTPACEKFDKLEKALDAGWDGLDAKKRQAGITGLEAALDDVKKKGKAYRDELSRSIDAELDGDTDMVRALKNLDNHVEMILKKGKSVVASLSSKFEVEKKNLSPLQAMNAQVVASLVSTSADLQRAAAGMEVMVRNIKAKPDRATFIKELTAPKVATRSATTALTAVEVACKASGAVKAVMGDIHKAPLAALNLYGASKDAGFWEKELAGGNETNAVMKHCVAIESQIARVKLIAGTAKRAASAG